MRDGGEEVEADEGKEYMAGAGKSRFWSGISYLASSFGVLLDVYVQHCRVHRVQQRIATSIVFKPDTNTARRGGIERINFIDTLLASMDDMTIPYLVDRTTWTVTAM